MAARDKKTVESSLVKKGFSKRTGDHSFFIYMTIDGRKTSVFTKTSFTPKQKDIGDSLLSMMARQCQLSKDEFCRLIDCPMTRSEYEQLLKSKGLC